MMGRALGAVWAGRDALGQDGSSVAPIAIREHVAPDAEPSWGEVSARGWNVAAIRRSFPDQWAAYLRAEYRTAYAVWKAFPGIDKSTAQDWISGKRDPKASVVIAECKRNDGAREFFLGAAA